MAKKRYSHKQIRKDLKKDELRNLIDKTVAFVKDNTENLLITVIIVGVIIVLIPLYFNHQVDNEMRAATMLNQAMSLSMQPVDQGQFKTMGEKYKQLGQQYADIVSNYPRTTAGKMALLDEANAAYYAQDYAKAGALFEQALAKFQDMPLWLTIKERLGNCYEQQQQVDKAIATYQEILKDNPDYFAKASVNLSLAHCYLALNKTAEARALLQQQAAQPKSFWTTASGQLLAETPVTEK